MGFRGHQGLHGGSDGNRIHLQCGRPGSDPCLSWEDSLEEGMTTHANIFAWRIPMDRGTSRAAVHGVAKSDMTE